MPSGVAARCLTSILVPTLAAPGGRCARSTSMAAFSMRHTTNGVANTLTPGFPSTSAVYSGLTTHWISAVSPGWTLMVALLFTATPRRGQPDRGRVALACRPEQQLQAEDDEQYLDDAQERALAHALHQPPPGPGAQDHDDADVEPHHH